MFPLHIFSWFVVQRTRWLQCSERRWLQVYRTIVLFIRQIRCFVFPPLIPPNIFSSALCRLVPPSCSRPPLLHTRSPLPFLFVPTLVFFPVLLFLPYSGLFQPRELPPKRSLHSQSRAQTVQHPIAAEGVVSLQPYAESRESVSAPVGSGAGNLRQPISALVVGGGSSIGRESMSAPVGTSKGGFVSNPEWS